MSMRLKPGAVEKVLNQTITDQGVNEFYQKLLETIMGSDAVAYRYFHERYSYGEMFSLMLKLNSFLSQYKNTQIVLYASKKFPTYAAIFSIILSNNTWLPLSPENPDERNLEILNQADLGLVIYEGLCVLLAIIKN